ncbi:MAG: hypothetical protein QXJ02_00210 [Candidatus Bathyarchaeia archaeon]
MAQSKLAPSEIRILEESLGAKLTPCSIRLREGEHQYNLAKTIAAYQLELHFPDVKEIISSLYGKEKADDIQFVRKIQTILKKMEKSNIVLILPKKRPWDLQRYGVVSFKFEDVEKSSVLLASDEQIKNAQNVLQSMIVQQVSVKAKREQSRFTTAFLSVVLILLYCISVLALMQPIVNVAVFVVSFSLATLAALVLGKRLSRGW